MMKNDVGAHGKETRGSHFSTVDGRVAFENLKECRHNILFIHLFYAVIAMCFCVLVILVVIPSERYFCLSRVT